MSSGSVEPKLAIRPRRIRLVATLIGLVSSSPLLQACGDSDPLGSGGTSYDVGDCVRIIERTVDFDIDTADCSEAVGTFDASMRIYRVIKIIENSEEECGVEGFFPVEFLHEPDGVTYCLVQED